MTNQTFDMLFPEDEACWRHLEATRWPEGPVCPNASCRSVNLAGRWAPRPHHWQCRACGRQFHARMGTPMEGSHLRLRLWYLAFHLLASASRPLPVATLARHLDVTRNSARSVRDRVEETKRTHAELEQAIAAATGARPQALRRARRRHHAQSFAPR